jgi:hypothetical protein
MTRRRCGLASVFPLLGTVVAVGTIYACTKMAHGHDHLPLWFEFPQISLTGIHYPERVVYAIGFGLSALILYTAGRTLGSALEGSARRTDGTEHGDEPSPLLTPVTTRANGFRNCGRRSCTAGYYSASIASVRRRFVVIRLCSWRML